MGSNLNRIKNELECTNYLVSIGKVNIICIKWGGKFKAISKFKCLVDGYEWETTLDGLKYCKNGCPKCSNLARINTIEDVNNWLKNNTDIICIYYDGTVISKNSKFKCLIDGYEWETSFNNIKNNGRRCPKCSNLARIKSISEVNEWLDCNYKEAECIFYVGNVIQLSEFRCKICCNNWKSTFNNIKNGNRCPRCSSSKGEIEISKILDIYGIDYIPEYWFSDCKDINPLPFDFAIFCNNRLRCLIEFQGIQHYEPVDFANKGLDWAIERFVYCQNHDKIKNEYCLKNNIPLLKIKYDEFENMDSIICNFLIKEGLLDSSFFIKKKEA